MIFIYICSLVVRSGCRPPRPAICLLPDGPGGRAGLQRCPQCSLACPTCPTACCALALLAAAVRIGAKRICGYVVRLCSLMSKSSCYLWKLLYPRQSSLYLASSHSSREIPACLKTFVSRSTLMSSPRCELGMMTESSPLAITSCFDPGNGPSNPNFLNRCINSLLETGVSLFDNAYRLRRNYNGCCSN